MVYCALHCKSDLVLIQHNEVCRGNRHARQDETILNFVLTQTRPLDAVNHLACLYFAKTATASAIPAGAWQANVMAQCALQNCLALIGMQDDATVF